MFRARDRDGILSFGESVKAADHSAIGKFGLGQKAVFHLCDAFVVHAFGSGGSEAQHEPCETVVNPFLGVDVDDNRAGTWDDLSADDLQLLRGAAPADCRTRALLLWLPFRRKELQPAPDAGFSNVMPRPGRIVADLARPDDLRPLLTALRHVESIEIRDGGELRCAVRLLAAKERLLGPERWPAGVRSFNGTVGTEPDRTNARFVAREATRRTDGLQRLQDNNHWPPAISALSSTPQPEKGEPHAAATLLRVPRTATSEAGSDLTISWAVFLPISEALTEPGTHAHASQAPSATQHIPLAGFDDASRQVGSRPGRFHLLLHGYFFLDSGRRHIEGLLSVNDQWGVFSRSRVQLLPHQLWVCRQVNREWPFRWLVADDVGLGKTIECGLVLMPLITSGRVRRLLILAPAKLVPQWQYRLKDMFDIRLQRFVSEADTPGGEFWATASMVVASFHTLRDDRRGARRRLLDADPWDLVIVDEAHHLGTDKKTGPTLAYGLLSDLAARQRIESLLCFTGTPHRGKDFGFFGLMHLVRPDLFDPEGDAAEQLRRLPRAMIRNNKAAVTDLRGAPLFQPVTVHSREYAYSDAESRFYETLSQFILDGRAYAATLDGRAQTARMLVLTSLRNSPRARSSPSATPFGSAAPCWRRKSVSRRSTRPSICPTMNR